MFKVGDIIVRNNYKEEKFKIIDFGSERGKYSVLLELLTTDVNNASETYYTDINLLDKDWDYDESYYRKEKINRIYDRIK